MVKIFDPTIFDNIKVVLEGVVYNLDLNNRIEVLKRQDLINLATMDRTFSIQYKKAGLTKNQEVELRLVASLADLATEILELENHNKPGCEINIHFYSFVSNPKQSVLIKETLNKIWNNRPIEQRISYIYDKDFQPSNFLNESVLSFGRKISEDNITDLDDLVKYTLYSLEEINLALD